MIPLLSDGLLVFIVFASILLFLGIIGLIILAVVKTNEKNNLESQNYFTDREILLLISEQPDGMMTSQRLSELSTLNYKQAKSRLSYLMQQGVLAVAHDSRLKYHYSLREKIDERPQLKLSDEPFLTVEDILLLFKHHDFKLTYQKTCISTGLPVSIIKREFKYFMTQKIMNKVSSSGVYGQNYRQLFLLEEPYRSNPDKFLEREKEINLELQKIYVKEMRHKE